MIRRATDADTGPRRIAATPTYRPVVMAVITCGGVGGR